MMAIEIEARAKRKRSVHRAAAYLSNAYALQNAQFRDNQSRGRPKALAKGVLGALGQLDGNFGQLATSFGRVRRHEFPRTEDFKASRRLSRRSHVLPRKALSRSMSIASSIYGRLRHSRQRSCVREIRLQDLRLVYIPWLTSHSTRVTTRSWTRSLHR